MTASTHAEIEKANHVLEWLFQVKRDHELPAESKIAAIDVASHYCENCRNCGPSCSEVWRQSGIRQLVERGYADLEPPEFHNQSHFTVCHIALLKPVDIAA